jgi:predicted LPLAT superfamily acyltransferase
MGKAANWSTRQERGSVWTIRLIVWLALRLGRPVTRVLLLPICLYFMLVPSPWQRASRDYLPRVLGRAARFADGWRHCHGFASCLLDRVYLLNGQTAPFDLTVRGAERITALHAVTLQTDGAGCLLFGAHLGSFEVTRAAGHAMGNRPISLVMYEDNARKTGAVLNAINPALGLEIIALGRPSALLAVRDRLEAGHLVGVLADRGLHDERRVRLPFLGAPAWFPEGPFRMAALLRQPVVFMLGIYRGGNRYDIVFEDLGDPGDADAMMRRYVALLERHCRDAPYNWFNFYDFWE